MEGSTFLGTILASAPDYGIALVAKAHATPAITDVVIARLAYSDSEFGAVPKEAYPTGASVICRMADGSSTLAYVISIANELKADIGEGTLNHLFYNVDSFTTGDAKTPTILLDSLLERTSHWFSNHAHGAARDILPGDYDVTDRQGLTGLHVGRLISQLRGSALAYIDVSGITHKVRLVGDSVDTHTMTSETLVGTELGVHNRAINVNEAFGIANGSVVREKEENASLELTNDDAIPLYRFQHIEGAVIGGSEDLIVGFPLSNSVHTAETEPPVLSKRRASISGELSSASAFGMSSIKAPYIAGVQQLGYGTKDKDGKALSFDDLRTPFEYKKKAIPERKEGTPEETVDDAALNKLIDTLTSGDYLELLQEKMAEKGLRISTLDGSIAGSFKNTTAPSGPTTEQQYPLPPSVVITDPATGEEKQYYASTSFITQEPDGSILLADGYGSEIRMSRGNIIISPALDLQLRPGRDLSAMVPRHQSYNAQQTTTINSSEGMYIRAATDLKMAGATSGKGAVALESKAARGSAGGLVIRSDNNLSMTGGSLYIGRNAHTGKTKNAVTEPDEGGAIIIDAGERGVISTRSSSFTADSNQIILGAIRGLNNTALVINAGTIGMFAKQVLMPSILSMQATEGVPTVSILRDGELESVALSVASVSGIYTNGNMQVDGNILCNGHIRANGGLSAKGVTSNSPYNGVVKPEEVERVFKVNPLDTYPAPQDMGDSNARKLKELSTSVYQDYYIMSNAFAFPDYEGIATNLRIPGMRWQEQKGGGVWKETYIKDVEDKDTACYPGHEAWEQGKISRRDYELKDLKTGYVINTITRG